MKTSNKILLVAILIFLGNLLAYNVRMKAEYLTAKNDFSKYEKARRFEKYDRVSAAPFNKVEIHTNLNVAIEQGPSYQVWLKKNGKGSVAITSKDGILSIDLTEKGRKEDFFDWNAGSIQIISPKVDEINVMRDENSRRWRSNEVDVDRFTLDSMTVRNTSPGTALRLHKNKFSSLNVLLGDKALDAELDLQLSEKTDVKNLKLTAFGKCNIRLNNEIQNLIYHVSDNCKISVKGAYLSKF